jgi:hypothetical protein
MYSSWGMANNAISVGDDATMAVSLETETCILKRLAANE